MCTTLQFKRISTIVKGNTIIIHGTRSDDNTVSVNATCNERDSPEKVLDRVKNLIQELDKLRTPKEAPKLNKSSVGQLSKNL